MGAAPHEVAAKGGEEMVRRASRALELMERAVPDGDAAPAEPDRGRAVLARLAAGSVPHLAAPEAPVAADEPLLLVSASPPREEFAAEVVFRLPEHDLAVLRVPPGEIRERTVPAARAARWDRWLALRLLGAQPAAGPPVWVDRHGVSR